MMVSVLAKRRNTPKAWACGSCVTAPRHWALNCASILRMETAPVSGVPAHQGTFRLRYDEWNHESRIARRDLEVGVGVRVLWWAFSSGPYGAMMRRCRRTQRVPVQRPLAVPRYLFRGSEPEHPAQIQATTESQEERGESEFDSLRPGDVFGHMNVSLRLTGREQSRFRPYTMAGSYVFTFSEEWGGETFSGTFEGRQSLDF